MASVLLIDGDKDRASGTRSLLREDGHQVALHANPHDWAAREREVRPDVVIATADAPEPVARAAGRAERGFAPPLLFVQHDAGLAREPYRPDRLIDRITSPFLREELLARVDALVRVRRVLMHRPAETPADGQTVGFRGRIATLFGGHARPCEKPVEPYLEVAAKLADFADRRDAFRPGHAERVSAVCARIAEGLDLHVDESAALIRAAMLHDIGKVALPAELLHQKEPLEESQMRLVRTHPRRGAALLRALDRDGLVADTVLYHHECPDGSGYYRRDGQRTPRTARVLAVAEVFDAMTSSTAREACSQDAALKRIAERRGVTLDADCVDALVDCLRPRRSSIPLSPRR